MPAASFKYLDLEVYSPFLVFPLLNNKLITVVTMIRDSGDRDQSVTMIRDSGNCDQSVTRITVVTKFKM
jgi:hypothetical protein